MRLASGIASMAWRATRRFSTNANAERAVKLDFHTALYCIEVAKSSSERWHCHFVGTCVGRDVGPGVGGRLYVGSGEGMADGCGDGIGVGTPLGIGVEGCGVGPGEGTADGFDVGGACVEVNQ